MIFRLTNGTLSLDSTSLLLLLAAFLPRLRQPVLRHEDVAGDAGGHLVRGSVGLAGKGGRLSASFSDFGRPVGGYSTAPRYPTDISPDSLDRLERERLAVARAPSNRVQGAGLDAELRAGTTHRFAVRGGWLRLASAAGDTITEPSAEAQYSFTHRRGTLNARWRHMPQALQGISLPGDETAIDASLRLRGDLRLTGRAYRTLNRTLGAGFHSEGEGSSVGLGFFRQGWRFDVRGGRREWSYGQEPTVARTVTVSVGLPVGPLTFSGLADVGEQDNGEVRQSTQTYNASLRWNGRDGMVSWNASYYESLVSPPRLRTDLLGSLKLGDWELAGGAWATRGWVLGGEPGFWTQIGMPVTYDVLVSVGIERAPRGWGQQPAWLGTFGIRRKLALAIPFLRDGSVLAPVRPAGPVESHEP